MSKNSSLIFDGYLEMSDFEKGLNEYKRNKFFRLNDQRYTSDNCSLFFGYFLIIIEFSYWIYWKTPYLVLGFTCVL